VDARFQLRQTILLVGVAVAVFISIGAMYLQVLHEQRSLLGVTRDLGATGIAMDSDDAFAAELQDRVGLDDQRRVMALAAVAAGLVLLLTFIAIRVTFRAAGPVVAASRMLRAMASGNFLSLRRLRKGDEFRFLEEDLFSLRESLKRDCLADSRLLRRLLDEIEAFPLPNEDFRHRRDELMAEIAVALKTKEERFGPPASLSAK
jgi:hypothetical protein